MSFLLASAARASTGARSGQEDAFRLWPAEGVAQPEGENGGLLAVLADGMGGHTGGAVAGETACSTFADVFATTETPFDQRLQSALQASNEALAKEVEQNSALRGMGCTLVAAWMDTLGVRWASVGDSLLLLYRFPDVIRLNADHSLGSFLDEQVRQNRITASEAKQHHNRNALRSALTGSKIDLIDLRSEPLELRAGDWILLASDGICSLEGDEIADIVYNHRQATPEQMADGLIAAVGRKAVAGQDNTTVVAVRIDDAQAASDAAPTRAIHRGKGKEETELRSRRIGMTGRKTTIPRRLARRGARSAMWFAAAAVLFSVFALAMLLRVLQPTAPPSAPETAAPTPPQPSPLAVPERATPDAPDPTITDPARPPAPPIPARAAPPAPQRATPTAPSPAPSQAPSPAPSQAPSQAPGTQSGDPQEVRPRTTKVRPNSEREKERRAKRQEQSREGPKDPPKPAPKEPLKSAPKEAPADSPREVLPQGFGGD
jgi:protein phosphatase